MIWFLLDSTISTPLAQLYAHHPSFTAFDSSQVAGTYSYLQLKRAVFFTCWQTLHYPPKPILNPFPPKFLPPISLYLPTIKLSFPLFLRHILHPSLQQLSWCAITDLTKDTQLGFNSGISPTLKPNALPDTKGDQ